MIKNRKHFQVLPFIISLTIPLCMGAIGGFFTSEAVNTWYTTLNKPSFNPPDWIFGPVWTLLYVLMGISAYRVWRKRDQIISLPRTIAVYSMQLLLNLIWSFLFFYNHLTGGALFEIIVLLIVIIINARVFYKIDKTAGLLFIPYILWVCFAAILNFSIYILN